MKTRSRILSVCANCRRQFLPIKYEFEQGRGRFCSYSCALTARPRPPIRDRFWGAVRKGDGCWEWTKGLSNAGYGHIKASGKTALAHRVSYELNVGPIPSGVLVCHKCDNRKCVRPDHLFLGTHAENTQDAATKNRMATGPQHGTKTKPLRIARGSQAGMAKLTEGDIPTIRQLAETLKLTEIARRFKVSPATIGKIVRGGTWRHVK